jgi:hypothetical protein
VSNLLGPVVCPRCRSDEFRLEDWETYISVLCRGCGAKVGELAPVAMMSGTRAIAEHISNTSSTPVGLLGRRVEVTLHRGDPAEPDPVIARGTLLRWSAMGEVVLAEDDGDVHWCWPALDIREADLPSNTSSIPLPPPEAGDPG